MTRSDYMTILAHHLRRLPREDYNRAIEYFEEYFDDAGPQQEQNAIEDLGSPEEAAKELIMNLAERNVTEPPKTIKRGIHTAWIGILGICAAPIAIPVALVILCLLFTCVLMILTFLLGAFCIVAGGIVGIIGGFFLLFQTLADGIATLGLGLFLLGFGILCTYGMFYLDRWILKKITAILGRITKGGRRHEA